MFSPQEWAIALTHLSKKADYDLKKLPQDPDIVHLIKPAEHIESMNARIESLEVQVENLTNAFNDSLTTIIAIQEDLQKAQGMLKFCYAICQNPAIKDLADSAPRASLRSLTPLSTGKQWNSAGRGYGSGSGPGPKPGLGGAGRP